MYRKYVCAGDKERAFTTQGFLNTRFNNRELHTTFLDGQRLAKWREDVL